MAAIAPNNSKVAIIPRITSSQMGILNFDFFSKTLN